ncbi:MAG: hypothetical protein MI717_09635 [Spirochaetales bacterium]|nr:hypothetical protein [Spirochaetales bacterium]
MSEKKKSYFWRTALICIFVIIASFWISGYMTGMKQNREGVSIMEAGFTLKSMNPISASGYKVAIRSNKAFMDHLEDYNK